MKTIGLLGGMSWESTVPYYRTINRIVGERLGGFHSAKILLYSVDFQEIEQLQRAGRWAESGEILSHAAGILEAGGAEFIVLCTNTMHKVAPQIEAGLSVPLLHIGDATAERIKSIGIARIGLLGTRFTMEDSFYRDRLERGHGLEVLVPPEQDRALIHRVIYEELCHGKLLDTSRSEFRRITCDLAGRGAGGVILGCTEIALLLRASDATVPLLDTGQIHAEAAAHHALGTAT